MDTNLKNCVELNFTCKNLPNKDSFSRTDAYVTVFLQTLGVDVSARDLGRTETVKDNLNPKFSKSFIVDYFFERRQILTFSVVDSDGKTKEGDAIGEAKCEFGEIMGSRGQCLSLPLLYKGKQLKTATIQVYADEVKKDSFASGSGTDGGDSKEFKDITPELCASLTVDQLERLVATVPREIPKVERVLVMNWHGVKLDKKDFLGKSDPYIKILRHRAEEMISVFQSEIIKKTLDPHFAQFEITLQHLCNNDLDTKLTVQCWDWDRASDHDLIGEFTLTAKALTETKEGQVYELICPKKRDNPKKYKDYKNSGKLVVKSCFFTARETMEPNPKLPFILEALSKKKSSVPAGVRDLSTFIQYLAGGLEISVIFGIDYTGSNGAASSASSLHYIGGSTPNPYQEAITAVGAILQHYDKDKLFPAYGYGASIKSEGKTLGEFSIQGFVQEDKKEDPHDLSLRSYGVDGVLKAYKAAVPNLSFGDMGSAEGRPGGGRYMGDDFYQLINIATKQVGEVSQTDQRYSVLLLIIDGDYFDNQSTIDAIVSAGDKPISIIIIGVGHSSFPNCHKFDADDEPLVHRNGTKMTRDIVQFVKFNDFKADPHKLAAEVLAELPNQVVQFLQHKKIYPNARIRVEL